MTKRRTAFYLAFGLVALLLLTACAGVAVGQSDTSVGATSLFGPSVDTFSLPAFDFSLAPAQNATMLRSVSLAEKFVEQATQMQQYFHHGPGGCADRDAYYDGSDL
jgi:hypothetical protein